MQKASTRLGVCLVLALGAARADEPQARFDGVWTTVVTCYPADGAVPYTYEFTSTVKNSLFHGERGVKGTPGWLQLEGRILPDGSAGLAAQGLVGKERAAMEHSPPGTPYKYRIDARFSDNSGSGRRVEGRTCKVSFKRKAA